MRTTPGWSSPTRRRVQRRWPGRFERPALSPHSAVSRVRSCSTYSTQGDGLAGRALCTAGTTGTRKASRRVFRDVGFEPLDAGPLRIARYLEPFSLAMAQLAYDGDEGPEIAYRIERFGK